MKNLLFIIYILYTFTSYAQNSANNIYAEYTFSSKFANKVFEAKASLLANSFRSIYTVYTLQNQTKPKVESFSNEETEEYAFVRYAADIGNILVFKDIESNYLMHNSPVGNKEYIINESLSEFSWVLTDEVKLVNDLKCFKATANFRGRKYIAWYTLDIPLSTGPWKFYGLPGLITDIYDTTNTFRWSIVSIKYPVKLEVDITNPFSDRSDVVSLKQYIENMSSFSKKNDRIRNSKLPKGVTSELVSSKRQGIELIYEWEVD